MPADFMSIVTFQHYPARNLPRYLLGCTLATLTFLTLMLAVMLVPAVSNWDQSISQLVQQLRSPAVDRIMLAVTLTADLRLATAVVLIVLVGLLALQHWWLAIQLSCVSLGAVLSVRIIKSLLERVRPELADSAVHTYSFPSGHACAAALVCGLLALLFSYRRTTALRYTIYAIGAAIAVLIAFSRVYLLVHWPSDVVAGLALGYALIVIFAWYLHGSMSREIPRFTPVLGAACTVAVLVYFSLEYSNQAIRYGLG